MTDPIESPVDRPEPEERSRLIDEALDSILTKDAELLARLADA